ncbi:hypothetical protein D9613_012684 [Agrocybe pediades]|uniref:Uncharacterized protein n=1 Tax=Agrocybe pediades TaxID=84607 RepID=A0A8H4QVS4_9AGAR|nr:hypothetical protein D9613_012684 [Agrocybe pediades]
MATIINDRISTPLKYVEIAENTNTAPSLEALEREYSDGTNEDHSKMGPNEGCFITKKPGCHLEDLYWVKPAANDARLRQDVANYLYDLNLVRIDFTLDKASNISPLDRSLHYALDKLGLFAVTCSKESLKALIALVERENKNFENNKGKYRRYFNLREPPLTDVKYELVLLHPQHLLPKKGDALTVFNEDGHDLSGKMYFVSPDGALREGPDDTQPRLPAFSSNRARAQGDMLNPFLVILNAEVAFRRFRERPHPLCQDYNELIDLTIELTDKVYFQPAIDAQRRHYARLLILYPDSPKDEAEDNDKPRELAKNSRMGVVIDEPGPDASAEEVIEYNTYLMSGCDYISDSDNDDDVYEEDEDDDE